MNDTLYFGTSKPGAAVSVAEWSDFLWSVVTPRFPQGFTAWQAYGQWKADKGEIRREVSYVVSIVHSHDTSCSVEHGDKRGNRIECRGNKASLNG